MKNYIYFHKKLLITLLIVIPLVVGVLVFLANKGFVAVDLKDQPQYDMTIQNQSKTTVMQGYSNGSKKLLNQDFYNFTAKDGSSSFIAASKTSGWLGTTSINGGLTKELYSNQVATNPASCLIRTAETTYSVDCTNGSSNLLTHHPATANLPSYQTEANSIYRWRGNIIFVNNQYIGLSAIADSGYIISTFPEGGIAASLEKATGLRDDDLINIKKYKEGFVVYAKNRVSAYYYKDLLSPPEELNFTAIGGSQFDISIYQDNITYYPEYSYGGEDVPKNSPDYTISVYDGRKFTTQDVGFNYKKPFLCGGKLICSLSSVTDTFTIDNINDGSNLENKYIFFGISGYTPYDDSLGLDAKSGLMKINPETGVGYFLTTYPENLSSCGISPISNQISLCLIDEQNDDRYVLTLSKTPPPKAPTTTPTPQQPQPEVKSSSTITKQMQELRQNDNIDVARLDGKFIYINTNVIPVINPETGKSETDPEELQYAKDSINRTIDELGIDRNVYTIVIL